MGRKAKKGYDNFKKKIKELFTDGTKTLFDHIKAITQFQDPNYFDKLEEDDLKTWSNYMIHRFLSMNSNWIEVLSDLQPYTEQLTPKQLYLNLYIGLLPKGRHYLRYVKGKKTNKYESWMVELIKEDFQCSLRQARGVC